MANYYYFAASLPSLLPGMAPPFPLEEFLEKARRFLNQPDFEVLTSARLFIPEAYPEGRGNDRAPLPACRLPLLKSYYAWEACLRGELARLRAQRLRKAAEKYSLPGEVDWDALRVAQAAFAAENPLEAELLIEKERWALVERLSLNRFFDMNFLAAYALKLQALARRERFRPAEGEAGYSAAYSAVLQSIARRKQTGESA